MSAHINNLWSLCPLPGFHFPNRIQILSGITSSGFETSVELAIIDYTVYHVVQLRLPSLINNVRTN